LNSAIQERIRLDELQYETALANIADRVCRSREIKLVLIDSYKGEADIQKLNYFIDCDKVKHLDYWRYSPDSCAKLIETVF